MSEANKTPEYEEVWSALRGSCFAPEPGENLDYHLGIEGEAEAFPSDDEEQGEKEELTQVEEAEGEFFVEDLGEDE